MKYALVARGLVENVILLDRLDAEIEKAFEGKQSVLLDADSQAGTGLC